MATSTIPRATNILVIPPHRVGEPEHVGEVLALVGTPGHEHYRVRWDSGEEEIVELAGHATVRERTPSGHSGT